MFIAPKKFISIFFITVICKTAISQTLIADSSAGFTGDVYTQYTAAMREELELFNGREHTSYPFSFDRGTPYFFYGDFSKGEVVYQNKLYKDVSLLYDVVKDEIAVLNYDRQRFVPEKVKVDAFTVFGHYFIKLPTNVNNYNTLPKGYYDVLYDGSTALFAKRTKTINTSYRNTTAETRVYSKDYYYLQKNNTLTEFRSKKSFLKLLSDKKKEVAQFIRQNNLGFRENKEDAMVKIISYYNSLAK